VHAKRHHTPRSHLPFATLTPGTAKRVPVPALDAAPGCQTATNAGQKKARTVRAFLVTWCLD